MPLRQETAPVLDGNQTHTTLLEMQRVENFVRFHFHQITAMSPPAKSGRSSNAATLQSTGFLRFSSEIGLGRLGKMGVTSDFARNDRADPRGTAHD
jgi:hypothetical protein